MAREARLAVTQPYHGPDGTLLYDVGHEFPLNASLPDAICVVICERPGKPAKAAEKPVKEPDA